MRFATSGSKLGGLSWQQALKVISGIDLAVCPVCKEGTVVRVAELKGCRAPPGMDMMNMFFETAD